MMIFFTGSVYTRLDSLSYILNFMFGRLGVGDFTYREAASQGQRCFDDAWNWEVRALIPGLSKHLSR